jgi:hypothetical protein
MASANSKNFDWYWKIFTAILGAVIIPLVGWIWNVNISVVQLQNDLGDAEKTVVSLESKVEEAEVNGRAIISIEKDIEYMKSALQRIETMVSEQ